MICAAVFCWEKAHHIEVLLTSWGIVLVYAVATYIGVPWVYDLRTMQILGAYLPLFLVIPMQAIWLCIKLERKKSFVFYLLAPLYPNVFVLSIFLFDSSTVY